MAGILVLLNTTRKLITSVTKRHSHIPRRAEYILDIIGAGAGATSETDWHAIWQQSLDARRVEQELDDLLAEGRKQPPVTADHLSEYSASWTSQVSVLLKREVQRHWRDPVYVLSKCFLNVAGGLFVGLTFLKTKHYIQGTQNLLFVSHDLVQECDC